MHTYTQANIKNKWKTADIEKSKPILKDTSNQALAMEGLSGAAPTLATPRHISTTLIRVYPTRAHIRWFSLSGPPSKNVLFVK
jgi:hypothetical protein